MFFVGVSLGVCFFHNARHVKDIEPLFRCAHETAFDFVGNSLACLNFVLRTKIPHGILVGIAAALLHFGNALGVIEIFTRSSANLRLLAVSLSDWSMFCIYSIDAVMQA